MVMQMPKMMLIGNVHEQGLPPYKPSIPIYSIIFLYFPIFSYIFHYFPIFPEIAEHFQGYCGYCEILDIWLSTMVQRRRGDAGTDCCPAKS